MIHAGELNIFRPFDVPGRVSTMLHVDREIAGAMQH
jgi:hypothetical protein